MCSSDLGAHAHAVTQPASKDEETTNRPDGAYHTAGGTYGGSAGNPPMGGTLTTAVGGNQAQTNLQPYLALPFVIALAGIFPSQN